MRNKESWFSVAIHPAFLIEDELEKARRNAKGKQSSADLQIGFPELEPKPQSVLPQTPSADLDEQRRGLIETLQAPARQVIRTIENRPPAEPVITEPEAPEPEAPASIATDAERSAAAMARIREGYLARTAAQARTKALTQRESDPVVPADIPAHARTERTFGRINDSLDPQIHPNDKIWPTGDSPSLVDRIRASVSGAGGHLQNLKNRLSRVFGSSPAAPASEAATPEAPASEAATPESPAQRGGSPDSQALVQNLLDKPVGQVDTADPEPVSPQNPSADLDEQRRRLIETLQAPARQVIRTIENRPEIAEERTQPEEKAAVGRPLSEIRTLRDAKAHSEKLDAVYRAHRANFSEDTADAFEKARDESIAADKHFEGHQNFEDAHTTSLLHGSDAITNLKPESGNKLTSWTEKYTAQPESGNKLTSSTEIYTAQRLINMVNAMSQRIEDAGGIHKAMEDPVLAPKIRLVHEAEEHMKETFPGSYAAMKSDKHDGDVLERPLEGIRNSDDAWNHLNKVGEVLGVEWGKFRSMAEGSEEKKAQRLLVDKAKETQRRAFAHFSALSAYQDNDLDSFGSHLDQLDPENMTEEDRKTYRIHMNAANTVLKQKIESRGGKDYAQYFPRIKAFQDRIRQIAEAHQAAGQGSSNQYASNQQRFEEKRREEIAKEQERQRNLRSITDTLGVKYGAPKRRR